MLVIFFFSFWYAKSIVMDRSVILIVRGVFRDAVNRRAISNEVSWVVSEIFYRRSSSFDSSGRPALLSELSRRSSVSCSMSESLVSVFAQ